MKYMHWGPRDFEEASDGIVDRIVELMAEEANRYSG